MRHMIEEKYSYALDTLDGACYILTFLQTLIPWACILKVDFVTLHYGNYQYK